MSDDGYILHDTYKKYSKNIIIKTGLRNNLTFIDKIESIIKFRGFKGHWCKEGDIFLKNLVKKKHYDFYWLTPTLGARYLFSSHIDINRSILSTHNIEHELLWQNNSISKSNHSKKQYYLTRYFERKVFSKLKHITCVSYNDMNVMKSKKTYFLPPCLPRQDRLSKETRKTIILFIGNFIWQPNIDALHILIKKIYPLLKAKISHQFFIYIVGKNPPKDIQNISNPDFIYKGFVEDLACVYKEASVVVSPTFTGSGTNIKIIEAMSFGKAIVTSARAAEAINAEHGLHLLKSNNVDEFADNIIKVLNNDSLRQKLENNSYNFSQNILSIENCTKTVKDILANVK